MKGYAALDLATKAHLVRNAIEDYNDLVAQGVSHEQASLRVGIDKDKWDNIGTKRRRDEAK